MKLDKDLHEDKMALAVYRTAMNDGFDIHRAVRLAHIYPEGRVNFVADYGVTSVQHENIKIVDNSCRTLEDFKEKYPEEFV